MKRVKFKNSRLAALWMTAIGAIISFSSFTVVRAERANPDAKVFTCKSGTACLQAKTTGNSTDAVLGTSTTAANAIVGNGYFGAGLFGASSYGYGVVGSSGGAPGIFGETTASGSSSDTPGIYGYESTANPAVAGYSAGGDGLYGASVNGRAGVYGYSGSPYTGNFGVWGVSSNGSGVYGYGFDGVIGEAYGFAQDALSAIGDNSDTYLFTALDYATNGECQIDSSANLTCSGTIAGGRLQARHRASTGQRILAYTAESTTATMEDVGHGRLFNGTANVMISSDFASVVDRSDYYVFLTPMGDASLYVSVKTANGFQVRETNRGRSDMAFDYRIVARPIDATGDRLPSAPRMHRPHIVTQHPQPLHLPQPPKFDR